MATTSQQVFLGDPDPTHDNVLTQVNVYSVYIGKGWELYRDLQCRIDAFLALLVNSPYMDMFANAGDQDGKHGYTDAAGNPIRHGRFRMRRVPDSQPDLGPVWAPDWTILHPQLLKILTGPSGADRFTLFMIFTPPGVLITQDSASAGSDWYTHELYPPTQAKTWGGWWVTYALCTVPADFTCQHSFDGHTRYTSHVIAEAVTDANGQGGGWAGAEEIADLAEKVVSNPTVSLTDPGTGTKHLVAKVVAKDGVTLLSPAGATPAEAPGPASPSEPSMIRRPRLRLQHRGGLAPRAGGYPTSVPAHLFSLRSIAPAATDVVPPATLKKINDQLAAADQAFDQQRYQSASDAYDLVLQSADYLAPFLTVPVTDPTIIFLDVRASVGLGDSNRALGDYQAAETAYFCSGRYDRQPLPESAQQPLASTLWLPLSDLYFYRGNLYYRNSDPADPKTFRADLNTAKSWFEFVVTADGSVPDSILYPSATSSQMFKNAAVVESARHTIASLNNPSALTASTNPRVASNVFAVWEQLVKINGNLDYWGIPNVPIWTFAYLQSVAINFAQLAIGAERDYITFQDRADASALTRVQLMSQASQSYGQYQASLQQKAAAEADVTVYAQGLQLAEQRAHDANFLAQKLPQLDSQQSLLSAQGQLLSGGDVSDPRAVSQAADLIAVGSDPFKVSTEKTIALAVQLAANRVGQQFQVLQLQFTAAEMQQAAQQAQSELNSAKFRAMAADVATQVASYAARDSRAAVETFESAGFDTGTWNKIAQYFDKLLNRYLDAALRVALLMQKAYNFENDRNVSLIKNTYSGATSSGLLASDALMADIQSFTEDLLFNTQGKKQLLQTTIRLAERYGYAFETQFRPTGNMKFVTTLAEFDETYPGTYAGRIRQVSVSLEGIVPPIGVTGTLTNSGISVYRRPSDPTQPNTLPAPIYRIQDGESLVLSDYVAPDYGAPGSGGMAGIFEGAGVASAWELDLPRSLNDIDYGAVTDVILTFTYEARFDPALKVLVLEDIASRNPDVRTRQSAIPLRWLYPDLFFAFVSSGNLKLTLSAADFRINETLPVVTAVSVMVSMNTGSSPIGLVLSLATPGKTATSGTVAAADLGASLPTLPSTIGIISSQGTGAPWGGLVGGSALGDWTMSVTAAANPSFAPNAVLDLSGLANLVVIFDYIYTPRT
jgi:Tc toxin complex TcA C-terminal TcB-binding domain